MLSATALTSCGNRNAQAKSNAEAPAAAVSVGVIKLGLKPLGQQLTVSSELVPFQEIDVYAKESGYVKNLDVDYGTHVKAGQIMAVLEIPELEAQLQQDDAAIKNANNQVTYAQHEVGPGASATRRISTAVQQIEWSGQVQGGLSGPAGSG